MFAAIKDATSSFLFPILGINSDNGGEFIHWELSRWGETEKLIFTRSRPAIMNDGAHVEQKNRHIAFERVSYHHDGTAAELDLLNQIWALQRFLTNHFGSQQKLISKVRNSAKTTQKYDKPTTPFQWALAGPDTVPKRVQTILKAENKPLTPAAIPRQLQALAA